MYHKQNSQWFKSFFTSQLLWLVIIVSVIVYLTWPLLNNVQKKSQIDREIAQLQAEMAKEQSQHNEFKKIINYLESDQFAEEQARLNLNLKRPGENVVSLKDDSDQASSGLELTQSNDQPQIAPPFSVKNRLDKWLDYFFGQE